MSLSSRRAWFSSAASPVRRNSLRLWCPDSATLVRSRSRFPSRVLTSSSSSTSKPSSLSLAQPLGDPEPLLVRGQHLLAGQLLPQPGVPARQLRGHLQRVHVRAEQLARLQVEQLAVDPLLRQVQVVGPLARGQRGVPLARFRVHQVGLERARVVPEQRVRQRAVTPEEPGQVQPHQQLGQRVEQPVGGGTAAGAGEHSPVGGGEVEEPGDQDRLGVRATVHHDADHFDRGHVQLRELPQQPVLAPGQVLRDLLERVQLAVVGDEPDDVPGDAALADGDQPLVGPLLERLGPRQGQQAGRMVGGRAEHEPHDRLAFRAPCGRHPYGRLRGRHPCGRLRAGTAH